MQKVQSNFVKPAGLAALAACALLSAYFGINALFAVLSGVFLLCLIAWLWTRFSLDKVSVEVKETELRGFPGSEISVPVRIENRKILPVVWLEAALVLPEDSCVSPADEKAAMFSWVMPWQNIDWHEDFKALRRGVCRFNAADAASGDGFGLSETARRAELPAAGRIVVYPELLDISVNMLMHRLSELEPSKKGFYTDPTLLQSVRDYIPTDSARDISWRLLARQGKVYVNVKEKMDLRRICLALDLESCGSSEAVEHMISVAASACAELGEKGVFCTLVLPSYEVIRGGIKEREEARVVIPMDLQSQTDDILCALAEVSYQEGKCSFPLRTMASQLRSLGQVFCFTRSLELLSADLEAALDCNVWNVVAEGPEAGRTISEKELLR